MDLNRKAISLDEADPAEPGWYGIVFVADEGAGFSPAVWGDAEYWEGGNWRHALLCGGERSVGKFDSRKEAKDWATEEARTF